jgi:chemotaxis signal transduction protein
VTALSMLSAEALREEFDNGFVRPRTSDSEDVEELIAITIGGDRYLVRLADIDGLHVDRPVTPAPTTNPHLRGLMAIRSALFPVYDLRTLLGYPSGPPARWLLLVKAADAVALSFDAFEAHVRVPRSEVSIDAPTTHAHMRGVVRDAGGHRSLVHLASLLEAINEAAKADAPREGT